MQSTTGKNNFSTFSEASDNGERNTLNRFARIRKPFSMTCLALRM